MNDLLWLLNHPLRGNVASLPTSRNPDTQEGLESQLSIGIHRIPTKLLHSIELELGKLCQTRMDSCRAFTLELLQGLLTSWEVLRPSEPRLSLSLSTLHEWTGEHSRGLNITLFTTSTRGSTWLFIGGLKQCSGWGLDTWGPLVRSAGHATWSGGQVSSFHHLWALDTLSFASSGHVDKIVFGNAPTHGWPAKVTWPANHTLAWVSPCFVPRHFLISYCLWLCLILDIMKRYMDFGLYGAFSSSNVPEMVYQQNSLNLLVISTYLWYLEWNVGTLVVNICILWQPTKVSMDPKWDAMQAC
jgi:hypothetical protein